MRSFYFDYALSIVIVWLTQLGVGGFTHAPGGAQWANKTVLSFHNSVAPKLVPDVPKYYQNRIGEARRLGAITCVTETVSVDAIADYCDEINMVC